MINRKKPKAPELNGSPKLFTKKYSIDEAKRIVPVITPDCIKPKAKIPTNPAMKKAFPVKVFPFVEIDYISDGRYYKQT